MSDADGGAAHKPTFFERLSTMLSGAPEDRDDLLDMLRDAHERKLLDADALSIFEGALEVAEMTVSDVMVPRSQMDVIEIDDAPAEVIAEMVETRHSRYPVIGDSRDEVVGILLAKDLLAYLVNPDAFSLKAVARPPIFVPETKRLNVLLREFRSQRNHMAIVIDEHGSVVATEHGSKLNPAVRIAEAASRHYAAMCSRFGLDPASIAKVDPRPPGVDADELERLRAARRAER